eukprot:TRINITY_DN4260_c1_g1_i1.p1 TRINITY_DN4260_c1_g1~~TRINITY_DN4260_c1_g1_i1.p1  ORF type:complete len:369 (+),score=56.93 TRINITY_DN4260_c1_g1_i1:99-1205(+)
MDVEQAACLPSRLPRHLHPFTREPVCDPFPNVRLCKVTKGMNIKYPLTGNTDAPIENPKQFSETMAGLEITRSTDGAVKNVPGSVGFLQTASSYKRMQNDCFSPETVEAYNKGRREELRIAELRRNINKPFETQTPKEWISTSKATHVNLLPVVEKVPSDTLFHKPVPRQKHRSEKVTDIDPNEVAKFAETFSSRHSAMNDTDALTKYQREAVDSMKRSYKPPGGSWVGGPPRTTYQQNLKTFDVRECERENDGFCSEPAPRLTGCETPGLADHLESVKIREQNRTSGHYSTTSSGNFQNRFAEAEATTHRKSHYFDKLNGTFQMPKRGNAPTKKANLGDTTNMSDVVPSHFMSSKTIQEQLAVAGLQ